MGACLFDPRAKGEMSDVEHRAWQAFLRRTAETWGEGGDGDIWLVRDTRRGSGHQVHRPRDQSRGLRRDEGGGVEAPSWASR